MKRLFIGIKIDPEEALLKMISNLKTRLKDERISWTASNNLHLTLLFLGDTEESLISDISFSLKEVCSRYKQFEITVSGAGVFRNFENPKILWTGVLPSDSLNSLAASVLRSIKMLRIKTDENAFNPHITLGRIKSISEPGDLKALLSPYKGVVFQKVPVTEIVLFESILHPSGPEYKPVAKYIL
jgi:RNA 2',3'-cyclic 3'-phosphodiesterase